MKNNLIYAKNGKSTMIIKSNQTYHYVIFSHGCHHDHIRLIMDAMFWHCEMKKIIVKGKWRPHLWENGINGFLEWYQCMNVQRIKNLLVFLGIHIQKVYFMSIS
jgi:hypothetical protein